MVCCAESEAQSQGLPTSDTRGSRRFRPPTIQRGQETDRAKARAAFNKWGAPLWRGVGQAPRAQQPLSWHAAASIGCTAFATAVPVGRTATSVTAKMNFAHSQ